MKKMAHDTMKTLKLLTLTSLILTLKMTNGQAMTSDKEPCDQMDWHTTTNVDKTPCAWDYFNDEKNEDHIPHICGLYDLGALKLIPHDAPRQEAKIGDYVKKLIQENRFIDLQNFLDAVVFPYIPIKIAQKAYSALVDYVGTLNESDASMLFSKIGMDCSLKVVLQRMHKNLFPDYKITNKFPSDFLRFVLAVEVPINTWKHDHLNPPLPYYPAIARCIGATEYTSIPPHIRLLFAIQILKFKSLALKKVPEWITTIDTLREIYVDENAEIPEILRNYKQLKVYPLTETTSKVKRIVYT